MQIKADQLAAHLARGLKPVYTVHGDEPLQSQEAADAVRAAARDLGFGERTVFTAAGAHFDWSGVVGAAQAQSLFADKQLVDLRIPGGKPGKDGAEALQRLCQLAGPDVLLLVQLPRLDFSQQKSAWFQALDAAGVTLRVETPDRRLLPTWLAARLARQGQRVRDGEEGQRTLAFFADRVEGNLLAAHHELQKLALLHPPGELAYDDVEAAVLDVARYDLGQFAEAVWTAQPARALKMLDGLRAAGESAVFVHWSLAEDLRALARGRAALDAGKPLPLALREARAWGAKERLFERVLPLVGAQPLTALVAAASVCDGIVKGLKHPQWPQDPWLSLRRLALLAIDAQAAPGRPGTPGRRLALTAD